MSQSTAHACVNCGSSVPETMRFCPNCGVPTSTEAAHHTPLRMAPPLPMYPQQQQPVYQPVPGQQSYQPPVQNAQPPPAYARPQKNSSRGILNVGLILLILLVLLGAGGFFVFRSVSSRGGNAANTGAQSDVTPTQASLTTTPINTTVTYASVNITILNAQQATSFADDHDTPPQGVVRLNLHAVQSDVNNVYSVSAPLMLTVRPLLCYYLGERRLPWGVIRISAGLLVRESRRPGSISLPPQA